MAEERSRNRKALLLIHENFTATRADREPTRDRRVKASWARLAARLHTSFIVAVGSREQIFADLSRKRWYPG